MLPLVLPFVQETIDISGNVPRGGAVGGNARRSPQPGRAVPVGGTNPNDERSNEGQRPRDLAHRSIASWSAKTAEV
jgi:hypothetical protein